MTRQLSCAVLILVSSSLRSASAAPILSLLGISPSPRSIDYVKDKTQFQLHGLLTEQRHPRTMDLGDRAATDLPAALAMLFSVDDDIAARLATLAREPAVLKRLSAALVAALVGHHKIYVYGCGATGRLAKQMESTFWRPFWRAVFADAAVRRKLEPQLGAGVTDALVGEMTGADRALISSLEGFEDLQLIGRRQLADHGITRGDVVIAVTEGGETSSVIGTILAASEQWKAAPDYDPKRARQSLFFIYNNPDERLLPFARSRRVIEEPGITKINLATGPQAITGSTRMQAATIETFVLAHALEDAARRVLARHLDAGERARLGFVGELAWPERLARFAPLLARVKESVPALAQLTKLEAETYRHDHFSTYFAERGLITVFIDGTERSPTFRLHPLDTVKEPRRRCWIQVWTPARDAHEAWQKLLARPFRGLDAKLYREPFTHEIDDAYLRRAALDSLERAGADQEGLYDFSFSAANVQRSGPAPGDLGVSIAVGEEAARRFDSGSELGRFAALSRERGAKLGRIVVSTDAAPASGYDDALEVVVPIDSSNDPFHIDQQIALKLILNAHSTAVMARLGRVVGNTMTNVSPSNLKLIGRATHLIQLQVNDVLDRRHRALLTYAEANAVLFDAMSFVAGKRDRSAQTASEVPLSIVRILESLRRGHAITWDEALALLERVGLRGYLQANEDPHSIEERHHAQPQQ
jgi:N-acetylmuramic acid 6-phosphate (MurNAc-6-P) etherase